MAFALASDVLGDFDAACEYEWLEPNGLGGWASSTVIGAHTRRYHGLLVAATRPPTGRMVLLSRLDETVVQDGDRHQLAASRFAGSVHPEGHRLLESFERDLFPVWTYVADGFRLRKTIVAVHGRNTTLVVYELIEAPGAVFLELRPFLGYRDYHALQHAHETAEATCEFEAGSLGLRMDAGMPQLQLLAPGSRFRSSPNWWYGFEYDRERERGLDHTEDLWTPGVLELVLAPGERVGVIATAEPDEDGEALALFEQERRRRRQLVSDAPVSVGQALTLAADAFVVQRGDGLATIVAGYHWFTDWGRDTMIALPGLTLSTGRADKARQVLQAFAAHVSDGMIPNRFPDGEGDPEYNTADATLWMFVAVHRYLEAIDDPSFVVDELLPVLRDILAWHRRGTRYGIRVDDDGLLCAGEHGVQLTWMDAKVGDWVVTPRQGKPVEICALWVNALLIVSRLEELAGFPDEADRLAAEAARSRASFERAFWNPETGYLFDVIDGEKRDGAIRPNALFALSLPYPLIEGERAKRTLAVVEERLLTPFGLRTLDPGDSRYCGRYEGGVVDRDGAYHQGTVWPWLLGPYVDALLRIRGETGAWQARVHLAGLTGELRKAGLGSLSEVYDGDAPHRPGGCIAQAWSVAEVIRARIAAQTVMDAAGGA